MYTYFFGCKYNTYYIYCYYKNRNQTRFVGQMLRKVIICFKSWIIKNGIQKIDLQAKIHTQSPTKQNYDNIHT